MIRLNDLFSLLTGQTNTKMDNENAKTAGENILSIWIMLTGGE